MTHPLIGNSKSIKSIIRQIKRLAVKRDDILVIGEEGTGKSLIARHIHDASYGENGSKPLLTVNLARTKEKELSELLSYYLNNNLRKPGSLNNDPESLSNAGTILLEEMEQSNFRSQSKVFEFLKQIEYLRHDTKTMPYDATRIIATIKNDPLKLAQKREMTVELAHYLTIFTRLFVPPLRERKEDIPYLVEHFVNEACRKVGILEPVIDIRAVNILLDQPWRNNIQELKFVIDRSILLSNDGVFNLPEEIIRNADVKVNRMVEAIYTTFGKLKQRPLLVTKAS
jgi:DNA-binding NtrC family response regulator